MTPTKEPVRYLTVGIAILLLILPHLPAFGVRLSPEQDEALNDVLPAVALLLGGEVVRRKVRPVRKLGPQR